MHSINFESLKVVKKEIIDNSYFVDLILENNGSFTKNEQIIWFKSDELGDDVDISVEYDIFVSGSVCHETGDYWTPPYTDADISEVDIDIKNFYIDGVESELTEEIKKSILDKIKAELY
jgi:hypothetical protein